MESQQNRDKRIFGFLIFENFEIKMRGMYFLLFYLKICDMGLVHFYNVLIDTDIILMSFV